MTVLDSVTDFINAVKHERAAEAAEHAPPHHLFSGEMEEAYRQMVEAVREEEASRHRYYGDTKTKKEYKAPLEIGGTIHDDGILDVESHNGKVVAVWFRCQALPFRQVEIAKFRAGEMIDMYRQDTNVPHISGLDLVDPPQKVDPSKV